MSPPVCLTGDKKGIEEFINKFDVSVGETNALLVLVTFRARHSCSIVMVIKTAPSTRLRRLLVVIVQAKLREG